MLDVHDLEDLRLTVNDALPDRAVISRSGTPGVVDEYGSVAEVWTERKPIPCRVDLADTHPVERTYGGQEAAEIRPYLMTPALTDLQPADRVAVTFRETGLVRRYEVIDVYGPRGYHLTCRALLLQVN